MKLVPIKFGMVTLMSNLYHSPPPYDSGNCFSLIDDNNNNYKIVNFYYENLKAWAAQSNQKDVYIKLIPKSNNIYIIYDNRIPQEWYNKEYCTTCTPLRMLPPEQRKQYIKESTFHKIIKSDGGYIIISKSKESPKQGPPLKIKGIVTIDKEITYAPYIPICK